MTPSFPVFLGLGEVPSLSTHCLFLCQAGGSPLDTSRAAPLGFGSFLRPGSAPWEGGGEGSASRQEKVVKPNFPAQSKKVGFLNLFPGCAEALWGTFALFLGPGECFSLRA